MSEDKLPRSIIQGEEEIALDELKVEAAETPSEWLLRAVQGFLSLDGKSFSTGAIRDLGNPDELEFTAKEAVNALKTLGYRSNFGRLKARSFKSSHMPLIAFTKNGGAVLVEGVEGDRRVRFTDFESGKGVQLATLKELSQKLDQYVVLGKQDPSLTDNKQGASWFWGSMFQSKWLYFQVLVAAALTNFLGLATSLFIMVVYDRVVPNEAIESLIALTVGVSIALGFDFIIKTLRGQFVDRAGQRADGRMARIIFDKLLSLRLDKRTQKSGAMASVVREFDTLREFFTSATLVAVVDLPFVFFFIWVISLIAGPLALVPLVAVPVVIFVGLIIQPFLARIAERSMKSNMSKQGVLIETLNGLETVQATGSGRLMRKRFEDASSAQSELGLRNRMLSQFAINSAASVQQVAQIATIFFGVFLIQDGIVTMGSMIAAVILGGRTLAPLSQLASALSRANSARQAYRSLSDLMKPDGEVSHNAKLSRPELRGSIELKNLTYTFPKASAPTVDNVSLKITPGQRVAVVGRMGSGKSTLVRMLSGLVEPSSGAVLIDGVDLRQIDPSDVRRNVGVMLQDTWLFSGSVRDNVQMGYYEYPDEHILRVCKVAGVDAFISTHPAGYDLELRERGEGLSGGQKQSINLARALLHDPSVLILDEPTSSMDQATEAAVIAELNSWSTGKTMIMITHRNSLLQLADRVLVVDNGSIITDTTPERLRAQQAARA
ncbi:type I secretion system permease/ATPase [Paracoccaceae bacterium]|nr:type I secretion system permease/ATPase [Paracoccaceae bacterium]